jgi:hypothetical protein
MPDPITLTIVTAERPNRLAKRHTLVGQTHKKETCAALERGRINVVRLEHFSEFGPLLSGLQTNQALIFGEPTKVGADRIVTRNMMMRKPDSGAVARTKDEFRWPKGPGIMALDFDVPPGAEAKSRDELVQLLNTAIPETKRSPLFWLPSGSSHIFRISDDTDLTGLRGQRLYLFVMEGDDIPRIGKYIETWSWANGHGRIQISASGQMLLRMTWDTAMWQANRLDFAAGASTGPGLEQRYRDPAFIGPEDGMPLDSRKVVPDPSPEMLARAEEEKRLARRRAQPQAEEVREVWLRNRRAQFATEAAVDGYEPMLEQAVEHGLLSPDFHLVACPTGDTEYRTVTVRDCLADAAKWDGALTRDPLEPDYDGHRSTGKLYLTGRSPCLHSLAHGGRTYRLQTEFESHLVVAGDLDKATDITIDCMTRSQRFFNRGPALVAVDDRANVLALEEASLGYHISHHLKFQKPDRRGVPQNIDPPAAMLKQVLSLRHTRQLPSLETQATAPLMRPDGSIVDRPGFDPATGVFFAFDRALYDVIAAKPDEKAANEALNCLLTPFQHFVFADSASKSALLAMIFTAILRPILPTAPGFVITSPNVGDGKSLLMQTLAALGIGRTVGVFSPLGGHDDEEHRKRLYAIVEGGEHLAMIFDNVTEPQRSQTVAAFLTATAWSDRPLAVSRIGGGYPTRVLFGMTGRNVLIEGDLPRRMLVCRLAAHAETALLRTYDFDPLVAVLRDRPMLITAALTLLRAARQADAAKIACVPSFEDWDNMVRRTVRWCGEVLHPGYFLDPGLAFLEQVSHAQDALDQHEMLRILAECFGSEVFSAADIALRLREESQAHVRLADAFGELAKGRDKLSSKSIGRHLMKLRNLPSGDFVLRSRMGAKSQTWWIENICPDPVAPAGVPF